MCSILMALANLPSTEVIPVSVPASWVSIVYAVVLKLSWCQFKLDCYKFRITVIPMVTTKKFTGKEIKMLH